MPASSKGLSHAPCIERHLSSKESCNQLAAFASGEGSEAMNHAGYPFQGVPMPYQGVPIMLGSENENRRDLFDLERLFAMVKRQAKVVAGCAIAGLLVGIIYLQTTPPTYFSFANVLIDEGLNKMVDEISSTPTNLQSDSAISSQIEIIKSARLADVVVDKLRLYENETFLRPPVSLLARIVGTVRGTIRGLISSPPQGQDPAARQIDEATRAQLELEARKNYAALMLRGGIAAQRVGRSYVVAIGYTSHDPRLAEQIARAYSEAYVADQLDASFEATEKAAIWLEGRLAELRSSSQAASLEVERFRAANGLASARGSLISEQQLAELNGQLALAQAETAKASARYEQLSSVQIEASDEAVLRASATVDAPSSTIASLRTEMLAVMKRQQDVIAKFGEDHPEVMALATKKASLVSQLTAELGQMAQAARNEFELASSREQALRTSLNQVSGQNSEANESMVHLRELEQHSTALNALYQTFLTRYEENSQQRSFPISSVRIISAAVTPMSAASPRTTMVLGLSIALGLLLGGGLGLINEFNERFFRTGDELRSRTGLKFLGYLPLVGERKKLERVKEKGTETGGPLAGSAPAHTARSRMRIAVEAPSSMYAETLRSAKIATDVVLQDCDCKVIGIVSALPGEGKSTFAANFAAMLSAYGAKTLLIDADLRNPRLTRDLGIKADIGLMEAVVNDHNWQMVAKIDRASKFVVIPAVIRSRFSHTSELLASAGMQRLMDGAKQSFEYIIVDLPPLGPIVDAKAFAPLADGFIMVVEWGRTPRMLVDSLLASEQQISDKIIGAALNKVDLKKLASYGQAGGSEKFLDKYSEYYVDEAGQV